MKRFFWAAAAAVLIAVGAVPSDAATLIDRIVAIVGDEVVTQSELDVEMAPKLVNMQSRLRGDELARATDHLRRDTLDALIDKKLQLREARLQGISVDKEELDLAIEDIMKRNGMDESQFEQALMNEGYTLPDYRRGLKEQLMIIRLVSAAVKSKILLEESEIKAYYDAHIEDFTEHESVRVANIFFPAKNGDMSGALDEANEARAQLLAGTPFEEMAVKCTGDDGAAKSCVLGTFGHGQLSGDIEAVAFGLKEGEVSQPIEVGSGYQLIKVMARTENRVKPIDEVRDKIVEELNVEKGEGLFAKWLQDLRDHTYVEIR